MKTTSVMLSIAALVLPFLCSLIVTAGAARFGGLLRENDNLSGPYNYVVKKFRVSVDHFSFALNDTFELRYLVNDTWQFGKNPPIFFYTGNEGNIRMFAQNSGFMFDIAPAFGALLVFAEHRFYGESMPYGNKSMEDPKHLGYLTSEQALADYVDLIRHIKTDKKLRHSPVIAFGGSYGGMLAAWIRMKYPHVIQGSISASGPVKYWSRAVTDCQGYARIVTSDFRTANPECPKNIRKSWEIIDHLWSTDDGKKWLNENWNLCKPLTNWTDLAELKYWLTDAYGTLAMLDYPYETNFLRPLPAKPVNAFCQYLTNPSLEGKQLLTTLYEAVNMYANFTGEKTCLSTNDTGPDLGSAVWDYQTCTEFMMPMCTDGVNDMFQPEAWDADKYSDACWEKFKVRPEALRLCKVYGCEDLSASSNIVFSTGLLDPWASGGVFKNLSATATAVIIPDGAHHLDLRGSNPADTYSVIQARKYHISNIKQWIRQYAQKVARVESKEDETRRQIFV